MRTPPRSSRTSSPTRGSRSSSARSWITSKASSNRASSSRTRTRRAAAAAARASASRLRLKPRDDPVAQLVDGLGRNIDVPLRLSGANLLMRIALLDDGPIAGERLDYCDRDGLVRGIVKRDLLSRLKALVVGMGEARL